MKKTSLKDKLFELAELVLDDSLKEDTPIGLRLDCLKHVSALYIGNIRATKNEREEEENVVTFDKLRQRVQGVE